VGQNRVRFAREVGFVDPKQKSGAQIRHPDGNNAPARGLKVKAQAPNRLCGIQVTAEESSLERERTSLLARNHDDIATEFRRNIL